MVCSLQRDGCIGAMPKLTNLRCRERAWQVHSTTFVWQQVFVSGDIQDVIPYDSPRAKQDQINKIEALHRLHGRSHCKSSWHGNSGIFISKVVHIIWRQPSDVLMAVILKPSYTRSFWLSIWRTSISHFLLQNRSVVRKTNLDFQNNFAMYRTTGNERQLLVW